MDIDAILKDFNQEKKDVESISRHTMSYRASGIDAALRVGTPEAARKHASFLVDFQDRTIAMRKAVRMATNHAYEKAFDLIGSETLRMLVGTAPEVPASNDDKLFAESPELNKIKASIAALFEEGKVNLTPADVTFLHKIRDIIVDADVAIPTPTEIAELREVVEEDPDFLPVVAYGVYVGKIVMRDIGTLMIEDLRSSHPEAADRLSARRRTDDLLLDYLRNQHSAFEALAEDPDLRMA